MKTNTINPKPSIKLNCKFCGNSWNYKGKLLALITSPNKNRILVTCTACHNNVRLFEE